MRRAPGRISGGCMLSTRISTRRDENGRAARAASMVWCCLGQHFAPPQLSCESPCAAPASALRVPVPLPSVLPSPAGQDHRSWARPAASGSPVCPSPGFWASSQVCCPFSRPCAASRTRPAAAPARLHAGPCRSQHHHPSPGHPPTSISTLLTRPSAVRASFLPCPCALSAGLVRRFQRPLRLSGQLPGRQEQRWRRPQRGRGRGRRLGRPDGRWRPRARPFGGLRRTFGSSRRATLGSAR